MKFFNIKLLALLALFSMSGLFAYEWGFSNHTKNTLIVEVKLMAWGPRFYKFVKPGKRVVFSWTVPSGQAGYCLDFFRWTKTDPNDPNMQRAQAGEDVDYYHGYPAGFNDAELIYLPDDVYAETVKSASKIGTGFDTFLCSAIWAIRIANKGACPAMLSEIINWIGGLVARSACRSREISIIEDPKTSNPVFTTSLN